MIIIYCITFIFMRKNANDWMFQQKNCPGSICCSAITGLAEGQKQGMATQFWGWPQLCCFYQKLALNDLHHVLLYFLFKPTK